MTTTDQMEQRLRQLRPVEINDAGSSASPRLYALHYHCLRLLLQDQALSVGSEKKLNARGRWLLRRCAFAAWVDAQELEPKFVRVRR